MNDPVAYLKEFCNLHEYKNITTREINVLKYSVWSPDSIPQQLLEHIEDMYQVTHISEDYIEFNQKFLK
jgi:hypothetical protein